MNDRDCETCVNKRHGMCSRWSCYYMNREQVVQALKRIQFENVLPSAQPKKGKWIETEFLKLKECSCCHSRWGMYDVENFDFCPNCGADMRGAT